MHNWREIVEQHGPAVWRCAYRLLGNDADAADCFQETFIAAVHATRRTRVENWSAFLRKICTARAMDWLRRRFSEYRRREPLPDWEVLAGNDPGPSQDEEAREMSLRVKQALALLPRRQAEVLCLRFLEELSYERIATELRISRNAVGVLLHKARERMRELLDLVHCQR